MKDVISLGDDSRATSFYEDFFETNTDYLSDWWKPQQLEKLKTVVESMELKQTGQVLDFGCGLGSFTRLLAGILAGWRVVGTDISSNAIAIAKSKYRGIEFKSEQENREETTTYDLIFSHHVFEHVVNVETTMAFLRSKLGPDGQLLVVVPCGNEGSLEYKIAFHTKDGIDAKLGNRFFYEAIDHQRRLRTEDLVRAATANGLGLKQQFYADQYWGGVEWISRDGLKSLSRMIQRSNASNSDSRKELTRLYIELLPWCLLRGPFNQLQFKLRQNQKSVKDLVMIGVAGLLLPISFVMDKILWANVRREWRERKSNPAGAEMWLVFAPV